MDSFWLCPREWQCWGAQQNCWGTHPRRAAEPPAASRDAPWVHRLAVLPSAPRPPATSQGQSRPPHPPAALLMLQTGPASLYLPGLGHMGDDPLHIGTSMSPTASAPDRAHVMVARAPPAPYRVELTTPVSPPRLPPAGHPGSLLAGRGDTPYIAMGPVGPSGNTSVPWPL